MSDAGVAWRGAKPQARSGAWRTETDAVCWSQGIPGAPRKSLRNLFLRTTQSGVARSLWEKAKEEPRRVEILSRATAVIPESSQLVGGEREERGDQTETA